MPVSGGRWLWTCIQFECLFQKSRSKGNAVHLVLLLISNPIYRICSNKNINHIITTITTTAATTQHHSRRDIQTCTHTLIMFAFSSISQHYFLVWKLVLKLVETRDIFLRKKKEPTTANSKNGNRKWRTKSIQPIRQLDFIKWHNKICIIGHE